MEEVIIAGIFTVVGALVAASSNFIIADNTAKSQYKFDFLKDRKTEFIKFFGIANRYKDKYPSEYSDSHIPDYCDLETALDCGGLTAHAGKNVRNKIDVLGNLIRSSANRGTPTAELARMQEIQKQLCALIDLMQKELDIELNVKSKG